MPPGGAAVLIRLGTFALPLLLELRRFGEPQEEALRLFGQLVFRHVRRRLIGQELGRRNRPLSLGAEDVVNLRRDDAGIEYRVFAPLFSSQAKSLELREIQFAELAEAETEIVSGDGPELEPVELSLWASGGFSRGFS